jgi:hypothetical protein
LGRRDVDFDRRRGRRRGRGVAEGRHGELALGDSGVEFLEESDELVGDFPVREHPLPGLVLGEDGKEFEVLVHALVHALHVPQVEWEVFRLCVAGTDLALQEDEGAGLRDDVSAKLCEEEVHHMDVALVDLGWR